MNDTPTPLTDELMLESINSPFHAYGKICKHARALERRLSEKDEEIAQLKQINLADYTEAGWKRAQEVAEQYQLAAAGLLNIVCAERDEAIRDAEIRTGMAVRQAEENTRLIAERDAALAEMNLQCKLKHECISALERTRAELDDALAAGGFCDAHKPNGGARNCLVCGCERFGYAFSRISYLCEPPNEMGVSSYAVSCDEDAVVKQVESALAACERMREALKNIVGTGALSNSNMGWRKCIELAEAALIPSTALHGWVKREVLEECVKAMSQPILNKHVAVYIADQFPAAIGHIPLANWFTGLFAAITAARAALEKTK